MQVPAAARFPTPAPIIVVVLALLGGAVCGLAFELPAVAGGVLAAGCGLSAVALWRRRDGWFLVGVLCAFAGGGALLAMRAWTDAWQPPLREVFDRAAGRDGEAVVGILTGVLRSDAAVGAESILLLMDARAFTATARASGRREEPLAAAATRAVRGGVQLSVSAGLAGESAEAWRAGRTVRMPVRLRRPQVHRNPGSPDEARALARRGIILTGSVKSGALIEVLARGSAFDEAAAATRDFVRRAVLGHISRWHATGGAIVAAILIGDRAGLSPEVQRSLQEAGTYHVIAISGGNIAIFATLTLTLFRWGGVIGRTAMVTAILLFLATRPVATSGTPTPTPLPGATPFLVGSPTTGLGIGDQAPEVTVKAADGSTAPLLDLSGKPVTLASLRGRLVLLNFWATWCPPCQAETPVLRDLDEQYRARGLSIVGVAVQETTPDDVAAYAAKYGLGYTIAFDGSADVFHAYKVFALPTQVLIAPDGRVIKVFNGPLTDEGGKALIEPLLPSVAPSGSAAPSNP